MLQRDAKNKIKPKDLGRKQVGLFGCYGNNFGDDLMATMFGRLLQQLDVSFTIFGLGEKNCKGYGFSPVHSVIELVNRSDIIIVGGGGLLLPHREKSKNDQSNIGVLIDECQRQSVPILCFSVGGAGVPFEQLTPIARRQLLEKAKYFTVRLRGERSLLEEAQVKGTHHEDVVWMTSLFFPMGFKECHKNSRPKIGICVYPLGKFWNQLLSGLFKLLVIIRKDCDFIFIEVKRDQRRKGKSSCSIEGLKNCEFFQYEVVEDSLKLLSSLDLLITSRLHVLIAGLSYRIPCISLLPRQKTVMYLKELGLGKKCLAGMRIFLIIQLFIPSLSRRVMGSLKSFNPIPIQRDAALHFSDLEEKLFEFGVLTEKSDGDFAWKL